MQETSSCKKQSFLVPNYRYNGISQQDNSHTKFYNQIISMIFFNLYLGSGEE